MTEIPKDVPRTESNPRHPIDGWEASNVIKPELGVLRISHVPGSNAIGLFIRVEAIMFPIAYFKNWHCAHRFAAWMEGTQEPEPTLAQQWQEIMAKTTTRVENAIGIEAEIKAGVMTFTATDKPVVPTPGLPHWPTEEETEGLTNG